MYLSGSGFSVGTHLPFFVSIHLFTFYFTDLEVGIRIYIDLRIVKTDVSR